MYKFSHVIHLNCGQVNKLTMSHSEIVDFEPAVAGPVNGQKMWCS